MARRASSHRHAKPAAARPGVASSAPRSVAITGAFGFLGRALIERLEARPEVERILALDLKPPPGTLHKTSFVQIDLTRPRADERMADALRESEAEILVHLALLYNPIHNASYAHEVEAIGTLQVLGAATAAELSAVSVVSNTALYGAAPDNPNFLTEDRPLRAGRQGRFLADKLEIERQFQSYREQRPSVRVAILRMAPILGPTVRNPATRLLSRPLVPVLLGCDPLMQFLHEDDAIRALELATLQRADGVYNIAPPGSLPLSSILKLLGRTPLPLPPPLARAGMAALWSLLGIGTPPSWLDYLRYVWVADGSLAERELGLNYGFSTRETVAAFGRSLGGLIPSLVGG